MVNVIGLGYIGLPTALMLASHGVEVVGTDCSEALVQTLNGGRTTFREKGLDSLFREAVAAGVQFTTENVVTDTYIVSVPTPYDKFSKKVDPCYVVAISGSCTLRNGSFPGTWSTSSCITTGRSARTTGGSANG